MDQIECEVNDMYADTLSLPHKLVELIICNIIKFVNNITKFDLTSYSFCLTFVKIIVYKMMLKVGTLNALIILSVQLKSIRPPERPAVKLLFIVSIEFVLVA